MDVIIREDRQEPNQEDCEEGKAHPCQGMEVEFPPFFLLNDDPHGKFPSRYFKTSVLEATGSKWRSTRLTNKSTGTVYCTFISTVPLPLSTLTWSAGSGIPIDFARVITDF